MLRFILESTLKLELQSTVRNYDVLSEIYEESLKASSNRGIACAHQYGSKSVRLEFEWKAKYG